MLAQMVGHTGTTHPATRRTQCPTSGDKRRGLITMRWAVGLALLMVMVFALTVGYHLGMEYARDLLGR